MKKTSVISINLKFLRIPFFIIMVFAVIFISFSLYRALPCISLNREAVNLLLSTNSVFYNSEPTYTEVFSLLKKVPSQASPQQKASSAVPVNVPANSSAPTVINPDAKVEITNSTNKDIDIQSFLGASPAFLKEDFSVLILHTHTTESYTPSELYNYTPTDTDRTRDKNFNMTRVGDEIEKVLLSEGIKVLHDTTVNDYPSYNGSYNHSLLSAENALKNDSSIKIILDVHRDAIEGKNGEKIKYTTEIDGKTAAKVMLVVGSNLSGLSHDNWETNMQFAANLQKHILTLYPSLLRPLNFRSQRFNQHIAPGAIIVEVGTNGNTLDEALLGAHYFAEGLADYINSQK